jgi:hypothetical protein
MSTDFAPDCEKVGPDATEVVGTNTNKDRQGSHMKKPGRLARWMMYGMLIAGVTGVAYGKDKTVLDQTALVEGFKPNHVVEGAHASFCRFSARIMTLHDEEGELKELHLTMNRSKFKLKNRRTEEIDKVTKKRAPIDYMNVKWNWISEIQLPDMRLFNDNDNKPQLLEQDYCAEGGDLSTHMYAFGITNLKDPKTKRSNPHAFIYLPMNKKNKESGYLGNSYYVFFFSIENDTSLCNSQLADYPRCKALRELAVKRMEGVKGKEFREEVQRRITLILPVDHPYDVITAEYHNGVIHGSL